MLQGHQSVALEREVAAPEGRSSREVSQVGTSRGFPIDTNVPRHVQIEFLLPWKGLSWLLCLVPLGLGKSRVLQSQCMECRSGVLMGDAGPDASEHEFHSQKTSVVSMAQRQCSLFFLFFFFFPIGFIFSAFPKMWTSVVTPGCQLSTAASQNILVNH